LLALVQNTSEVVPLQATIEEAHIVLSRLDNHLLSISVYRLTGPAAVEALKTVWPRLHGPADARNLPCWQWHVQRIAVHEGNPSPVLQALNGVSYITTSISFRGTAYGASAGAGSRASAAAAQDVSGVGVPSMHTALAVSRRVASSGLWRCPTGVTKAVSGHIWDSCDCCRAQEVLLRTVLAAMAKRAR
jgi:hypothetical protein